MHLTQVHRPTAWLIQSHDLVLWFLHIQTNTNGLQVQKNDIK